MENGQLNDLPWEQINDLVRRQVVHGEAMSLTRYEFRGDGGFALHSHPSEQITFLLEGTFVFTVADEVYPMNPGDVIVVSPNVWHSATAGPDGARVLSVVSPSRRDGDGMTYR